MHKIQRKTNEFAGSQKKRVSDLGKQLEQVQDVIANMQAGLAEATRRARVAEERATRAEQVMKDLRDSNYGLRARMDALEQQLKQQTCRSGVNSVMNSVNAHGDDEDFRFDKRPPIQPQPFAHQLSSQKYTSSRLANTSAKYVANDGLIEYWDSLYEIQQQQQQQQQQDQEPERKRPRTTSSQPPDLTPLSAQSRFSQQSWTGAAATAQAVALAAAASAVGALQVPGSPTKNSNNCISQYDASVIPASISHVSLAAAEQRTRLGSISFSGGLTFDN